MIKKRTYTGNNPQLLFYAPLTVNKDALYTYDNSRLEPVTEGSGIIHNNALYLSARTPNMSIRWDCKWLPEENITFNCFINPTSFPYAVNFMFGMHDGSPSTTRYRGFWLGKHVNSTTNSVHSNWINYVNATNQLITPLGIDSFVSMSIQFLENNNYKFSFYKNGIFINEYSLTNANWIRNIAYNFQIGLSTGSNDNQSGYYRHFSVYKLLTDQDIKNLYLNKGIPNEF